MRKRLIDSFGKYDLAAKRLRDLPTDSSTQKRLQKAIYMQSSSFLHLHMLPLKSLPKILKHAAPTSLPVGGKALASIRLSQNGDSASQSQMSESDAALSQMEDEERRIKERLIVLEEQRFMVQEMLGDARRGRRFDEVTALKGNLDEVDAEIALVHSELGQLDWGSVYDGAGGSARGSEEGSSTGGIQAWLPFSRGR